MKNIIKTILIDFKIVNLLRRINKKPRILYWHGVDYLKDSVLEAESFEYKVFKDQIDFLEKNYEIVSIDDFYYRISNNKITGKEVVLTFDDGYRNNLTVVAPFLKEKEIPFTVFISTNNITHNKLFPTSILRLVLLGSTIDKVNIDSISFYENISSNVDRFRILNYLSKQIKTRKLEEVEVIIDELISNITEDEYSRLREEFTSIIPMNWEEVRNLLCYGATIGSHCLDHICCHDNQDTNVVKNQIFKSKDIIEKELNVECKYFAYPNGDYTKISNELVEEAGYIMGFSTKKNIIDLSLSQRYAMPRLGVSNNLKDFIFNISIKPYKKNKL
ncbi:polysaccharide deacetylase family protein [Myroides sp. TSA_177.3]|uniref:polysaccharide deacetylase family protein n=1 Tax=Myroides sp. TSA_177.3 TaxID=3415650 RepID=UPI004045D615